MGTNEHIENIYDPGDEDEAVTLAVRAILKAANYLCTAADLAPDGTDVRSYVNASIHLRDLVHSLVPERPEWPTDGAAIYDLKTKQRVN